MKGLFLSFIAIGFIPIIGSAQPAEEDGALDSLLNISISTAAKYGQTTREAPASVSVVTSEDIERFGYRTLDDVLKSVRGFYTTYDRNYTYVGVRGFGRPGDYNSRILLLLNGRATNDNIYGMAFVGTEIGIDLHYVDRIEIVRGPGSALYGAGAMFAVINVITKSGNSIDGVRVGVETGSFGRRRAITQVGKKYENGLEFSASGEWMDAKGQNLYYKEYDDPATNYGRAIGRDWDKNYGVLVKAHYSDFSLQGLVTSRTKGIPTGSWGTIFNDPLARTSDENSFVELKYNNEISSDKNLTILGYYNYYRYESKVMYDAPLFDQSLGRWFGGEAQYRWDIVFNNRLTIGFEYRNNPRSDYKYWDPDNVYFERNVPYNIFSFYLQDEYQVLENISVILGVRRDKYSTTGGSITPRAALVFDLFKESTLKLLYGEAFRAPNFYEVYFEHPSGYKGNASLLPERIKTTEIIWEQRFNETLFGTVSYFNYRVDNLIDQVLDPIDSLYQFRNVSVARAHGVEIEFNARTSSGHRSYVSYSYQDARDYLTGAKLTNSPNHLVKLGWLVPVGHEFFVSADLVYESSRRTVFDTETNDCFLTNLSATTGTLFDYFRGGLTVRNVFNISYKTPGGAEHLQDAIIQDGRNLTLRIEAKF